MTTAPPLFVFRTTKFLLLFRNFRAKNSSLVILLFGGFTLRRITEQSCLISSLTFSERFLKLFSMLHKISSIGILRGAMTKLRPLSSNLVVYSSMGWVDKLITKFLRLMVFLLRSMVLTCLLLLFMIFYESFTISFSIFQICIVWG